MQLLNRYIVNVFFRRAKKHKVKETRYLQASNVEQANLIAKQEIIDQYPHRIWLYTTVTYVHENGGNGEMTTITPELKEIQTEAEYLAFLKEAESLMHIEHDCLEARRLGELGPIIEAYEKKHYPIGDK